MQPVKFCGLLDPALQRVLAFERGLLGRDQPEHGDLVARQMTQRLKAAGAVGVVFEEEAVAQGRLHADVGGDADEDQVLDVARAQHAVELAVEEAGIAVTPPGTAIAALIVTEVAPAAAAVVTKEPVSIN